MPAVGSTAVQVTNTAGTLALESPDVRELYDVTAIDRPSSLWRAPLAGGPPVKVLDGVVFGNVDVIEVGIYFIDRGSGDVGFYSDRPVADTAATYFDFATKRIATVAHDLGRVGSGLSASRHGRTVFYSRLDSYVDELMLVEDFR
jgi:hypothetical protein